MPRQENPELTSFQKELALTLRTTAIMAPVGHVRPMGPEGLLFGGKRIGNYELWHKERDTFILDQPQDETEFAGKQHETEPWRRLLPYYMNARNVPLSVQEMMGFGLAQIHFPMADFVVGIPNAGTKLAQDFSRYSQPKIPFLDILTKEITAEGRKVVPNGTSIPAGFNKLLLVDNAIATGWSLFETIEAVTQIGGQVVGVLEVWDREEGGFDTLGQRFPGIRGLSVLQCRSAFAFLRSENRVSEKTYENIHKYLEGFGHRKNA